MQRSCSHHAGGFCSDKEVTYCDSTDCDAPALWLIERVYTNRPDRTGSKVSCGLHVGMHTIYAQWGHSIVTGIEDR